MAQSQQRTQLPHVFSSNLQDADDITATPSADTAQGRRLYVGKLAYATTESDLKKFFQSYLVEPTSVSVNRNVEYSPASFSDAAASSLAASADGLEASAPASELRLACPFVKRHGRAGATADSCEGKGWNLAHRVKEHCYRNHKPLQLCPRCNESFAAVEDLTTHVRSTVACEPRPAPRETQLTTLTLAQFDAMKKRKKKSQMTEGEKWTDLFKDIFPDQLVLPSPYVDVDDGDAGVSPYFQDYVRTQLKRELIGSLRAVPPQLWDDPDLLDQKTDEALVKVIANYKRRRTTTGQDDVALPLKPVTTGQSLVADALRAKESIHPPESAAPFSGSTSKAPPSTETSSATLGQDKKPPCDSRGTMSDDPYAFLTSFDTIFLIDDSGSMSGQTWRDVASVLNNIASAITSCRLDGSDVFLSNQLDGLRQAPAEADPEGHEVQRQSERHQVAKLFSHMATKPPSSSSTGDRLNRILAPYVQAFQKEKFTPQRPLSMLVISDGDPSVEVEDALLQAAKGLASFDSLGRRIGIQFLQLQHTKDTSQTGESAHQLSPSTPLHEVECEREIVRLHDHSFDELFNLEAFESPEESFSLSQLSPGASWLEC